MPAVYSYTTTIRVNLLHCERLNKTDCNIIKMKHWILLSAIIINHVFIMSYADNAGKNYIIEEIVQKICTMDKGTLSQHASTNDVTAKTLKELEDKLEGTIDDGHSDRNLYAKIIMDGIKTIVLNEEFKICNRNLSEEDINMILKMQNGTSFRTEEDQKKKTLAKSIAVKIENLVKKAMENKKTIEEKHNALNNLKRNIINTFKRNQSIKENRDVIINLLLRGIENAREKIEKSSRRLANRDDQDNSVDETTPIQSLTVEYSCDTVTRKACEDLKRLDEFICAYDKTVLSVQRICDGVVDCPDGSDETDCIKQAVERVHSAGNVMADIVVSKNCFKNLAENSILSHQGAMLSGILQRQLEFITKFTATKSTTETITESIKDAQNAPDLQNDLTAFTSEVSLVLKTFVVAVHGALCMDLDKEAYAASRISEIGDLEDDIKQYTWSPKFCACQEKLCVNDTCSPHCQRFCYEKFVLSRWSCKAASGEGSVSLNLVCDGKYDCLDESDELNCATGNSQEKFEAGKLYNEIFTILKTKIMSQEYESVSNQFRQLHGAIKKIHKASKRTSLNSTFFRDLRDKCFAIITLVYVNLLESISVLGADNTAKVQDTHEFLMSLGEKLMNAMKLSNTGNPKVMFLQGCDCRGNKCIIPLCSKRCTRFCTIKPMLTAYTCGNSPNSTRVSIDQICNGKPACPKGEDEENCKLNEICRRHQLVVLKHSIQSVGQKHKGTILGEVLETWKARAVSSIVVSEKMEQRLTPHAFKTIVSGIVFDLVNTYVSLQEVRRSNNENDLKKFEKLAQRLMESLKSCGK